MNTCASCADLLVAAGGAVVPGQIGYGVPCEHHGNEQATRVVEIAPELVPEPVKDVGRLDVADVFAPPELIATLATQFLIANGQADVSRLERIPLEWAVEKARQVWREASKGA